MHSAFYPHLKLPQASANIRSDGRTTDLDGTFLVSGGLVPGDIPTGKSGTKPPRAVTIRKEESNEFD